MDKRGAREERIVKWGKEKRIHGDFAGYSRALGGKIPRAKGFPIGSSDLIEIRTPMKCADSMIAD